VNPYQWLHELYSEEVRGLYAEKLVWNGAFVNKYMCNNVSFRSLYLLDVHVL
jgi:hypothetical protein